MAMPVLSRHGKAGAVGLFGAEWDGAEIGKAVKGAKMIEWLVAIFVGNASELTSQLLWFYVVLAASAITVFFAYGARDVFCISAWATFILFFVWVAASNSWHLVPKPDPEKIIDPAEWEEAWRLWSVYILETLIVAYLIAAAISLGIGAWFVWGAYTKTLRFTMLTAVNSFTVFTAQTGEVLQRWVCSSNSPDLGREYFYWAQGRAAEACGRLFADVLSVPYGETVGPLFFPAITASPLLLILGRVYYKKIKEGYRHSS